MAGRTNEIEEAKARQICCVCGKTTTDYITRYFDGGRRFHWCRDDADQAHGSEAPAPKYGDAHGWCWHVYEIESHGMGYQIELERVPQGHAFVHRTDRIANACAECGQLASRHYVAESDTVGPELDSRADAERIVEIFRATWGGTYTFHSHAAWLEQEGAGS